MFSFIDEKTEMRHREVPPLTQVTQQWPQSWHMSLSLAPESVGLTKLSGLSLSLFLSLPAPLLPSGSTTKSCIYLFFHFVYLSIHPFSPPVTLPSPPPSANMGRGAKGKPDTAAVCEIGFCRGSGTHPCPSAIFRTPCVCVHAGT